MSSGLFDHFTGASLDTAKWTAVTAGDGAVTVSGGALGLEDIATEDAAFVYPTSGALDLTKPQVWGFMVRCLAGSLGDVLALWTRSGAPGTANSATLDGERLTSVRLTATPALQIRHDPTGAAGLYWDSPTNSWGAPDVAIDAVTISAGSTASWYLVQLEMDPTLGFRWAVQHAGHGQAMATTLEQGVCHTVLTDWVAWTDFTTTPTEVWMTIGTRDTSAVTSETEVEFVTFDDDGLEVCYSNSSPGKPFPDAWRLESNRGASMFQFLPKGRTDIDLSLGTSGQWDDWGHRDQSVLLDSGGTLRRVFMGWSGTFSDADLGLATAGAELGTWTKDAGNPIVEKGALPVGFSPDELTAPFLIEDLAEPNAAHRFKLFVGSEGAPSGTKWRIWLFTCATVDGTYVLHSGGATDGALIAESGTGWREHGADKPVIFIVGTTWYMTFAAKDDDGWTTGLATSTDRGFTWSLHAEAPIISAPTNAVQVFTGHSGTALTGLTDTSVFAEDQPVYIQEQNNEDRIRITRIRKLTSATAVELYHNVGNRTPEATYSRIAHMFAGGIYPTHVEQIGGTFYAWATSFQPFSRATGLTGNLETNCLLSASAPEGPWSVVPIQSPVVPLKKWAPGLSNRENLTFARSALTAPSTGGTTSNSMASVGALMGN